MFHSKWLVAVALIGMKVPSAHAEVIFSFQRLNDTDAILTATGSPDWGFPTDGTVHYQGLEFIGLIEHQPGGVFGQAKQESGDFMFGSVPIAAYFVNDELMRTPDSSFLDDTVPTGTAFLRLYNGTIWGSVGTFGGVDSNYINNGAQPLQIGQWRIVEPVPETSTLLLVGVGLGALTATRRRPAMAW